MNELEELRPTGATRARGLVSDPRSGRRVDARRFAAPPDLAGLVECLWVGRWSLPDDAPHRSELLADPSVNLVFETPDQARVVGVWTTLWTRELRGTGLVRAAKLLPGAVRAVLGRDADSLRNRIEPLDAGPLDAGPLDAGPLLPAVLGPESDQAGLSALVDWLRAHVAPDERSALAVRLVQHIHASGLTRVDALAEEAGMSARALQRLFRTEVGATPKWVIRRFRLQEAALRIETGEAQDLASLALDLGYADQAHMARDFRAATGKTMGAFGRLVRPHAGPGA